MSRILSRLHSYWPIDNTLPHGETSTINDLDINIAQIVQKLHYWSIPKHKVEGIYLKGSLEFFPCMFSSMIKEYNVPVPVPVPVPVAGITGILCRRFCHKVVLTDHNEEVLKIVVSFGSKALTDLELSAVSIPLLFDTVQQLLAAGEANCKFMLAYVSHVKVMDAMVITEAVRHGLVVNEVAGTRTVVKNLEGVVLEITLS